MFDIFIGQRHRNMQFTVVVLSLCYDRVKAALLAQESSGRTEFVRQS
jgi:hypothetical protein